MDPSAECHAGIDFYYNSRGVEIDIAPGRLYQETADAKRMVMFFPRVCPIILGNTLDAQFANWSEIERTEMPQTLLDAPPPQITVIGVRHIRRNLSWPEHVYAVMLAIGIGEERLVNGDAAFAILMKERAKRLHGRKVGGDG
jgi:hypothetical protein